MCGVVNWSGLRVLEGVHLRFGCLEALSRNLLYPKTGGICIKRLKVVDWSDDLDLDRTSPSLSPIHFFYCDSASTCTPVSSNELVMSCVCKLYILVSQTLFKS